VHSFQSSIVINNRCNLACAHCYIYEPETGKVYNKYGKELIYDMYTGELEVDGAVGFLRYIENVADQFSLRKCRELKRLGVIPENEQIRDAGGYDHYTDKMFENYLNMLKNKVMAAGITKPDYISELIYNLIKPKL
jgi:hypothetical protein